MSDSKKCPKCGHVSDEPFDECPKCGVVVEKFLEKEKTRQRQKELKETEKNSRKHKRNLNRLKGVPLGQRFRRSLLFSLSLPLS